MPNYQDLKTAKDPTGMSNQGQGKVISKGEDFSQSGTQNSLLVSWTVRVPIRKICDS